jgi:hypothetical protein
MICPHCRADVRHTNRTGNRCGSCNRRFALEPHSNTVRMHDVRLRRLADNLARDDFRFTVTQLYYAAMRKSLRKAARPRYRYAVIVGLVAVVAAVTGLVNALSWTLVVAGVLVCAGVALAWAAGTGRLNPSVAPPMDQNTFTRQILGAWRRTYGADPPGLVRESTVTIGANPAQPVLAVLCPSKPVLTSLWANDITNRGVALARRPDAVPADVPVALLHDVSVEGYLFAGDARSALAGRTVVDITPRPRTVRAARGGVLCRDKPPAREAMDRLHAAGTLTHAELAWLAKGWWSPAAALRPSTVVGRVERAVASVGGGPATRAAATVGFLTWPKEPREVAP